MGTKINPLCRVIQGRETGVTYSRTTPNGHGMGGWNYVLHSDPGIIKVDDNCPQGPPPLLNQEPNDTTLTVSLMEGVTFRYRERGLQTHETVVVVNPYEINARPVRLFSQGVWRRRTLPFSLVVDKYRAG